MNRGEGAVRERGRERREKGKRERKGERGERVGVEKGSGGSPREGERDMRIERGRKRGREI